MAIAFDATAGVNGGATWTHTCAAGASVLFVGCQHPTDLITGVTYNSVAMTQINKIVLPNHTNELYLFYLVNPTAGANTVSLTGGTASSSGGSTSYTGAKTTGVPDASNTGSLPTGSPITVAVTTVLDNCWLVAVSGNVVGGQSAGANTTIRTTQGGLSMSDSNAAQTPAGSYSLSIIKVGADHDMVIASFAPLLASTSNRMFLVF